MKKTYLLLIDIVLIVYRTCCLKGLTSYVGILAANYLQNVELNFIKGYKKDIYLKLVLVFLIGLISLPSLSQTYKPFSIRKKIDVRGKMIAAGNTILGKDNFAFNDNTKSNQDLSMNYIDIDEDPLTFSSSSADLSVPPQKNGSATTCYRVAYAALYWGAMLQNGSRSEINKIKLKLPGNTAYTDINGEIIYDAIVNPIVPDANKPYACYADVTNLLSGLTNITGTYTVANLTSSIGTNGATGLSAGWTLFVVYEDPTLHMKSFNVFDGFSHIYSSHFEKIPVTGFITPPSGNIDLQFAYAALDGDKPQGATKLEFGTKQVVTPLRPANNFFISTIENTNGVSTPRNPFSSNTLGYDTGTLEVVGANPEYINNNQSSTDFTLQVAKGQADPIFAFFSAYAVDIIAPKIDLTKLVKNTAGVNIGGGNVTLGQSLTYEISYQSVGNDNVTNFTIKDVLPINITFDPTSNIDLTNAGGATFQSYNPLTRTIIFNVPNSSVEVNDGIYTIRLNIKVVPDCNSLTTACSNVIKNQAFATYQGVINTTVFQEEGSFASTACKLGSPESTNFLVDISNCKFSQNIILCGSNVVLKAADGYSGYSWSRNPDGSAPIATGQTFTATQTGVYYVQNTAPATCKDIVEEITVRNFGVTNTNPVIPYAQLPYLGEVVTCPNDGKQLPNLFLCGANDSRVIRTGINNATSIEWYKLNESSCAAIVNPDCANENPACSWILVGTGPDFNANISGQFRLTIKYPGGCFSQFYFNVYQNLLNPTVSSKDILCTSTGQITVKGVPPGYEYSLDSAGPYQPSNIFPNASFPVINAGDYTVYIKQIGVNLNPCVFSVPNILIRNRNFSVSTILKQPLCKGEKGTIKLIANDALPQYYFSISQGATLINSVGPITANEYEFSNLNVGVYTVNVKTDDGCNYSNTVSIADPLLLTATAAITKPLTCTDGEITVYPTGGTPPYIYYVNSSTVFQNTPQIIVTNPLPPGEVFNITIEDSSNCIATTSITVAAVPPPVYSMSQTNIKCYNDNTGVINFNVTNASGYTLAYSIDNGTTYLPTPIFSNLVAGTYNTIVRYTLGSEVCFATMQPITITQPSAALTASAGVSELAGCGPAREGKTRITNPQGGVPPYEYSFDNQATWTTNNEAYKAAGTYTLYVRDSNNCTFSAAVTIDPEPISPNISTTNPVDFNCDGTANSTVTVNNPGGVNYTYSYYLDGVKNTNVPPNVFLNVPSGTHSVKVDYLLSSVTTFSTLLAENFGTGNPTTTSGIAAAYCFNDLRINAPYLCGTRSIEDNQYSVTNDFWRGDDPSGTNVGSWYHFKDHTTNGVDPKGRFLLVNIGSAAGPNGILYSKPIVDVIPNQPVKVDFAVANLLRNGVNGAAPDILVQLVDGSGIVVEQKYSGKIAESPTDPDRNNWVPVSLTLNPGNNTNLSFVVRSGSILYNGNDVLIDGINVYQLPKTCITSKDFTIVVPTGKAFDASITGFQNVSCSGANDGTITIAAQNFDVSKGFEYSINNGTTWNTQLTSPHTITGLANGTYAIQIRYDASGTCLKTFSQIITAPTPLSVTALVTTAATCTAGATITAAATGGTLAYQYELKDAAGVVVIRPYQLNPKFTNVFAGNYTVVTKDARGCISLGAPINILAPTSLNATLDVSSDICFDSLNQASLVVNASGGAPPFVYSLDGTAAQNGPIFTNVGVGNHNIVVTDSNNCIATISGITIAPQLIAVASTTKPLDCSSSPNAIITGNISGGTAPYAVTVLSGTGPGTITQPTATAFTYTTAVPSTYQFQIQDAKGCITSVTAIVNSLVPIATTSTNNNPSCNGALDGSVQIIPSGGTGPYTYSIDALTYVSSSLFSGLGIGTYTFYVKDSKECISNRTVSLTQPTVLVTTATATSFSCSATNTKQAATINVAIPTTGTAPYQYSFNSGGYTNTNTLTINDTGIDQVISFSVKDAKGCTYSSSVTVLKLNPPTDLSFTSLSITCSSTTSTVTATTTNGAGMLTYAITFPVAAATSNTTGVFAGLLPGTYIFRATDANGCYYSESYVVNPVTPITVLANKLSDVLCNGDNSGAIRFTLSGFSGTYNYSVNGGTLVTGQNASTVNLNNLSAGTYTLLFTDDLTSCTASTTVTINQPIAALSATIAQLNANCFAPTSRITVTAIGGTASYKYAYKQDGIVPIAVDYVASNQANLNPITNTNWDIWIKDANGCEVKYDILIAVDAAPAVTASAALQCLGVGSYTITAVGSAGVTPLTYSINNGASYQTGNTFVVTSAGNYTIKVKDANGCTADSNVINVVPQLTLTSVLDKGITCIPAPTAAQITLITIGGAAPFTYEFKEALGLYTAMANPVFNSSIAGSYTFRVTDANGCKAETATAIVTTTPLNPDITAVSQTQFINCNGDDTAAISVVVDNSKGQSPFVFNVLNTTTGTNYGAQTSGLSAGNYTITITDAKGCTDTYNHVINEPLPLTYSYVKNEIVCSGSGTTLGSIIATPIGGTLPYSYTITNNVGAAVNPPTIAGGVYTFNIVNFGIYEVSFVDANGCNFKQVITMASPPNDLIINVNNGAPSCTTSTIEVTVAPAVVGGPYHFALFPIISGSTPPYEYITNTASYQNANDSNILNPGYLQSTFTGLNPGVIYSFIVYDEATNCYYFKQASSPTLTASTLTSTVVPNNVKCKGAADGTVDFTFTNTYPITTDVTYQIFNSQTNLPTTIPTATVTGLNGTITTPINGLGLLGSGTYYILFKEISAGANNGCTNASATFTISESPFDLSITANIIKNAICNTDGIIAAQAQGGTAPYTYQVTTSPTAPVANDSNWVTGNTFAKAGSFVGTLYYVYTKDTFECIKQTTITLLQDAPPTITAPTSICYDGNAFTIDLSLVSAATILPATYSVNGSAFQSPSSFTFNSLGLYNLVIKDGNGCTANVNFEVYPKLNLSATLTKNLDCTATPNATITLTATGGNTTPTSNYIYEANYNGGGFVVATNPYSAASAGTYVFRVTDANNVTLCQTTTTFIVDAITPTLFATIPTNVKCNTGNDGTITVNVTSGVGPYQYQLDSGIFQSSNLFSGLSAGTTYVITVRDAKSCLYPSTAITITEPVLLTANSNIITALTCGAGNASQPATVTVNGIGGTAPYFYSFDGGINYSANNMYQSSAGTIFDVFVKDANGCLYTVVNGINITSLGAPTDLTITTSSALTCLAPATVEITGQVGGIGIVQYETIAPSPTIVPKQTSTTFANLPAGTYIFQVTDANLCIYQESYLVNPVNNITVSGQLINDISCNPGSNGQLLFNVANFAGTYTYSINGGAISSPQTNPTISLSGLTSASTQTIIVTDVITGCTATTFVNVAQTAPITLLANPIINANCNFGAQVSVTASGGVAPYTYSYVISGAPVGTYSTASSALLDPTIATSWDVYVKDANNCVISTPLTITVATDPLPAGITASGLSQCPSAIGTYTFTINVATGVGPYEYSIGSGFQNSPTFTVNNPGTYTVIVKDANGCSTTVTGLVQILPALQLQADVTGLPTCTDGDGLVTLIASGGSGNYEYRIDSGTPQVSSNFTGIFAGIHTLTVVDLTTNCSTSISVNLGAATAITGFTVTKSDVSCNGGNDGLLALSMGASSAGVNDNPMYTYSIDGGTTSQTSTVFNGLIAGTYTVIATSGRGCTATQVVTITEPAIINVPIPTIVEFGCNAGNTRNVATITVSGVTGGSGVYSSYEFIKGGTRVQFGPSNIYTEADLMGGTYIVIVYDDQGCVGNSTAPIVVIPYITLDAVNVAIDQVVTCTNLENITVSVATIGGSAANLVYTVVDSNATTGVNGALYSQTNTTGIFAGLAVANYLITVRNLDTNCEIQGVHYVNEPNTFDLILDNTVDVTCFGGTNGSANLTFVDRVITASDPNQAGPFSYTVTGPVATSGTSATAGPIVLAGLAAGTYTVSATLTNAPYCSATKNFTIVGLSTALTITETHTEITCVSGNNDGSITASASGGWLGTFEFQLELGATIISAWSSVSNYTALSAGSYTLRARDTKGCEVSTIVVLNNPTPIAFTASPSSTLLSCFGDKNASISVSTPTGGQGSNYLYTLNSISAVPVISSGPQAVPNFSGLGAGTYTITVTDGWSCSATSASIVINEPSTVVASLALATTQTCLNTATLTLSAVGGTPPYYYSTDGVVYNPNSFLSSLTFPVAVGTHRFYVKDVNNCASYLTNDIKIEALPTLTVQLDLLNLVINCKGDATGVIEAKASGGLGNYLYTLQDAVGNPIPAVQSNPGVFTQLVAGVYKILVTSLDCATTSALITITEPTNPLIATYVTTNVTCNGANNGKIEVNASGGTGTIKYAISPRLDQFFTSTIFDLLAPGFYDIIAQDQNGCYIHTLGIEIREPAPIALSVDPLTVIPEYCFGDNLGSFILDIAGGTAPYSFSLDNNKGPFIPGVATQTQFDFNGLAGGNHTVYIRDANGCNAELEVVMPESVKLDPNVYIDYGCLNNSPSLTVTVSIDSSITNLADVDYALDGSGVYQSSNLFSNVSAGIHFITARHTNGCEKKTPDFEILQIAPLSLELKDGGLNEIVATAIGGTPSYRYTLNGEDFGSQNTFVFYKSGDYTVTVTDANGCVASATRFFEFIDIKIPNVFTPNGDGDNDGWTPTNTMHYPNLVFHVFDRYGRKVGTYREGEFWDGKYNGNELPTGDYWYALKLQNEKDSREFVGHFTLYR